MSFNSQNPLGESDNLLKLLTYLECEYVIPRKSITTHNFPLSLIASVSHHK